MHKRAHPLQIVKFDYKTETIVNILSSSAIHEAETFKYVWFNSDIELGADLAADSLVEAVINDRDTLIGKIHKSEKEKQATKSMFIGCGSKITVAEVIIKASETIQLIRISGKLQYKLGSSSDYPGADLILWFS